MFLCRLLFVHDCLASHSYCLYKRLHCLHSVSGQEWERDPFCLLPINTFNVSTGEDYSQWDNCLRQQIKQMSFTKLLFAQIQNTELHTKCFLMVEFLLRRFFYWRRTRIAAKFSYKTGLYAQKHRYLRSTTVWKVAAFGVHEMYAGRVCRKKFLQGNGNEWPDLKLNGAH